MIITGIESSAYFTKRDYAEGLKKIAAHGYDCIDYRDFSDPNSEFYSLEEDEFTRFFKGLKQTADSLGVKVWQMHENLSRNDSTAESRARNVLMGEKALRAAGILGCKYYVIHPVLPYGWGKEPDVQEAFDYTAEMILRLLPTAKNEGVTICLENIPLPEGHSFSRVKDTKDLVRNIDDANVGACFDTGHCNAMGEDQYEAIKLLGKDIVCLHVHDDINRQDRHLMPFQGQIKWEKVIKGLKEIGFKGCVSLETEVSPETPEPMREQMRIALSGIARYIANEIEGRQDDR